MMMISRTSASAAGLVGHGLPAARPSASRASSRPCLRVYASSSSSSSFEGSSPVSDIESRELFDGTTYTELKKITIGPSSRQKSQWANKMKKSKMVRTSMKKGDWNDLEFMNNNWELRELKPKRKLRRKYSFTEADTEEEYQELKKQLAVDTTVLSTIATTGLIAAGEVATGAAYSYGCGCALGLVYMRLMSANVESVQTFEQNLRDVMGGEEVAPKENPLAAAAPLRFLLPWLLIALSTKFDTVSQQLGFDSAPFDFQLLPSLAGLFTYKAAVIFQVFRSLRDSMAEAGDVAGQEAGKLDTKSSRLA
mmetsp:Transcript_3485/g.7672  ORF Transcript_3485/g.7672 Transcript_3485/m.7672 type:complete len:308 (-) Transcript_3485:109-1032(-)